MYISCHIQTILDLIITNVPVFDVCHACHTLVPVDLFHQPFSLSSFLAIRVQKVQQFSKFRYAYVDDAGLYGRLRSRDWSGFFSVTNVDSSVDKLMTIVQAAIKELYLRLSKEVKLPQLVFNRFKIYYYIYKKRHDNRLYIRS